MNLILRSRSTSFNTTGSVLVFLFTYSLFPFFYTLFSFPFLLYLVLFSFFFILRSLFFTPYSKWQQIKISSFFFLSFLYFFIYSHLIMWIILMFEVWKSIISNNSIMFSNNRNGQVTLVENPQLKKIIFF